MARQQPPEEGAWQEVLQLLDLELCRLPDKYRIPVILCELEGRSRQDVARQLGLPEGTLSSRLARARAMLARRLTQRGVTLAGGTLAAGLSQHANSAVVPPSLIVSTVKAGASVLAGQSAAAGVVSAHVAALSDGVVKTMFISKLKIATTVLLVGNVFALGTGETARRVLAARGGQLPEGRAQKDSQARGTGPNESGERQVPGDTNALLKQALETAKNITDPFARIRTLCRISSIQSTMGRLSDARKTQQEALHIAKNLTDGQTKVYGMREVAYAQAGGGDRSAALETLQQAEQAATAIQDTHKQDLTLLNLLSSFLLLQDYREALQITGKMKDFEMRALESIAHSVRKNSGQAGSKALKQVCERVKLNNSTKNKPNTLIVIATAYVRIGDLETAHQIADTLGGYDKIEALEAIGVAQAKAEDIGGALRTASAIDPDQSRANLTPRANVLQAVAIAQQEAGDSMGARITLQKLRQITEKLGNTPRRGAGPSQGEAIQAGIAGIQAQLGDFAGALHTASAIHSLYQKTKTLLEIGTAQAGAGKVADARETLLRAAYAAEDNTPAAGPDGPYRGGPSTVWETDKASTMRQIAEQQAKAGDIKQALRTVENIPTNVASSLGERDLALAGIVRAQAESGDFKGGLETLARIQNQEEKTPALEGILQAQVRAGDIPGALALAARQLSPYQKANALLAIAWARVRNREKIN